MSQQIFATLVFLLINFISFGQSFFDVQFNNSEILTINGLTAYDDLTYDNLTSQFGLPDRQVQHQNGQTSHIYDKNGFAFTSKGNEIAGVFINFTRLNLESLPKDSFNGRLIIGDQEITKKSTEQDFKNKSNIDFKCSSGFICSYHNPSSDLSITIVMAKEHITNVSILLNPL